MIDELNQTTQNGINILYTMFIKFKDNQNKCSIKFKNAISGILLYNICNKVTTTNVAAKLLAIFRGSSSIFENHRL